MADRVQDRFQVNAEKIAQIVLNAVIVGKPDNPGLPDPNDIAIARDGIKSLSSELVLETFFERSWPYWNNLALKEKEVLISSANKMMPEINPSDISIFKLLFTAKLKSENPVVTDQVLNSLWLYFHQMVRQCISYGLTKMGNADTVMIGKLKLTKSQLTEQKAKWEALKNISS